LLAALLSVACGTNAPDCSAELVLAPTVARPEDPDLTLPPAPPPGGDEDIAYCPTPPAGAAATPIPPETFVAAEVANLSLDLTGQELAAVAMGDDRLAVAWLADGEIFIALARGGNNFQVRSLGQGELVSLAFSPVNRLHTAYARDGQIFYRAADQGAHPADAAEILVDNGETPQVIVDELNWAHVLFARDGNIYEARHLAGDNWLTTFVTAGSSPRVIAFQNDEAQLFGIPAGQYWFGIFLAVREGEQLRLLRFLSWFNLWQQVAEVSAPAGETLLGQAGMHYLPVDAETSWVTAAWTTLQPALAPPPPAYGAPVIEAANPLYPDALANPQDIYQGLQAVRVRTEETPFAAGLLQTTAVTEPFGLLQLRAYARAEAADGATLRLRIGLDPTGGTDPHGASVVWSATEGPGPFRELTVDVPATGPTATVFLDSALDAGDVAAVVAWDAVTLSNGILLNGDFEGPFIPQSNFSVPAGWTAYYADAGVGPPPPRDIYRVYAAWSSDGGLNWSAPEVVAENKDATGAVTGAIRPDVYPFVSVETDPPAAAYFYVYEAGDPPPGTGLMRFGRPHFVHCTLGTTDCDPPEGERLLPAGVARPGYGLLLTSDPFSPTRGLLAWDALQTDYAGRDVYATYLVLR